MEKICQEIQLLNIHSMKLEGTVKILYRKYYMDAWKYENYFELYIYMKTAL
jgi:hypothetical protein